MHIHVMLGQALHTDEIQTLQEAIEDVESNTDYIFNYDPILLQGYFYDGQIKSYDSIRLVLDKIFYDSPFDYELKDLTVIVYRSEPQSFRICGTLLDASNKEPLIAANITVIDSAIGTLSDEYGYFDFEFTGYKNQEIELRYLGYQAVRFSVQEMKEKDCPTWLLQIDASLFGGNIVITDYLLDGISLGEAYGGFSLDFDQLSERHSRIEHDVLKTAQFLPGINSIDDSATNLQIRGSNPGQNLVLWEGAPLYNAGHVFGMISAINPFTVKDVNIYKGAYDPKYDNRVGGILDISLAEEVSNSFHGSFGTTLTEWHSNLTVPIIKNKASLEVSARQSINTLFDSPTLQSYTDKVFQFSIIDDQKDLGEMEQFSADQSLSFSDWNAKLLYRPSEKLLINGGIYRNAQDFNYSFLFEEVPFLSEDSISLKTQIISFETAYQVSDKWLSQITAYHSSYENNYDKRQSENSILLLEDDQFNQIDELSVAIANTFAINKYVQLSLGYENNTKEVLLDLGDALNFDMDFIPIDNERASFHNLFQSFTYTNARLKLDAGNRSSYYNEVGRWFHSPRVNVQYAIGENLKLKADGGIYYQFISQLQNVGANQIKVDNPLWLLNASNTSLSQKAQKVAAGIVLQEGPWLIDLDVYHNNISNINTIGPNLGIISELGGFSRGDSKVYGLDLLLKKRWGAHIDTWLSYTWGSTKYCFPDFRESSFTAPNDIRHNLSFVSSYNFQNFELSINVNYHSGLPFTNAVLTLNEDDPDPEHPFFYFLEYEDINNERLGYYLRTDINVARSFNFMPVEGSRIELSCSLLNVFNRTNYVAREYFVDYDAFDNSYNASFIEKALLDRTVLFLMRFCF